MNTTGWALLEGAVRPRLVDCGRLTKSSTADVAEQVLRELVDGHAPSVVAVDAPLTLPPCLTCPESCRGPGAGRCEMKSAEAVWAANGNPVTERLCEVLLRAKLQTGPLPTMRIGQIAGRGVVFARRMRGLTFDMTTPAAPTVIEVYPYATLSRLGAVDPDLRPRAAGESETEFAVRVIGSLAQLIEGLEPHQEQLQNGHIRDALIAAYTGWLGPEKLQPPPEGFNVASGWIWTPVLES